MASCSPTLTAATFFSAFIGAAMGVILDRFLRRIEARPLFRVQVGEYEDLQGKGRSLTITNVGLEPVAEYKVALYHPQRGSLEVFREEASQSVFPQYPDQENRFKCPTQFRRQDADNVTSTLKWWFHHVGDQSVSAPAFDGFALRLVLRNSERTLFEDEGLGNYIAAEIYEDITGGHIEQRVEQVSYRSKAPFWVELIRTYRHRRMLSRVDKEDKARTERSDPRGPVRRSPN